LERGCVVLDQPQHARRESTVDLFQWPFMAKLLRLVCDTTALRGQRRNARFRRCDETPARLSNEHQKRIQKCFQRIDIWRQLS
jgi:hypothetical protein